MYQQLGIKHIKNTHKKREKNNNIVSTREALFGGFGGP